MPRTWQGAPNGYIDMEEDDYDQNKQPWMHKMQSDVVKPINWIHSAVSTNLSQGHLFGLIQV